MKYIGTCHLNVMFLNFRKPTLLNHWKIVNKGKTFKYNHYNTNLYQELLLIFLRNHEWYHIVQKIKYDHLGVVKLFRHLPKVKSILTPIIIEIYSILIGEIYKYSL